MAASQLRLRFPLRILLAAAVVASALSLPTHPDAFIHPEDGNFGLRIRAVRRPDGSSHVKPTGSRTHPDHHIRLPAVQDSEGSHSAPHETIFGDRKNPLGVKTELPTNIKNGAWQSHPDVRVVLPSIWEEAVVKPVVHDDQSRGDGVDNVKDSEAEKSPVKAEEKPLENEQKLSVKPAETFVGTGNTQPATLVVLPQVGEESIVKPVESEKVIVRDEEITPEVEKPAAGGKPAHDENRAEIPTETNKDSTKKRPDTMIVLPQTWEDAVVEPAEDDKDAAQSDEKDDKISVASEMSPEKNNKPHSDDEVKKDTSLSPPIVVQLKEDPVKHYVVEETHKQTSATPTVTVTNDKPSPSNAEDPMPISSDTETGSAALTKEKQDEKKNSPEQVESDGINQNAAGELFAISIDSTNPSDAQMNPPQRNVPPEFYMTRKNHAARPHVRPHDSNGPDFIAENPLYEWTFPCSAQEKSCLDEDRVLYEGDRRCYQLWRSGPCERAQWLIIDKTEALNGSGRFRAVCSNMSRCPERQVYMASDRRCHPLSQIIAEICPNHQGLQLSYNVFGEGECKCENCPAPQLPTNTFNEGRCAFPPSFYRADTRAALGMTFAASLPVMAGDGLKANPLA